MDSGLAAPPGARRPRYDSFSEEHEALRESIARYVAAELTPHTEEWERDGFPDSAFRRMGELGFLGLDKPEAWDGQGGDYLSGLVLTEELWYGAAGGLALAVGVQTGMALPPLLEFGTDDQRTEWAAPAIRGEKILCLGISEPDAGSDVAGIRTRATRDGSDYVINGSKLWITNGHRADVMVLLTRSDPAAGHGGFTLFALPMDAPGVTREKKLDKLGMRSSDTALIAFNDVRVPDTAVLGREGRGFHQIMWQLQGERLLGAAGNIAMAQRALDITTVYVGERQAFGRPLAKLQALRHRLAELATELEGARELTYATARRINAGEYPVREISMSKLLGARVAFQVCDACLQFHGGAGYVSEYEIERLWRDVRVGRIGGGADEVMLDVISRCIGL
jgi:alkylation response protein AidB-like acyl-CoA dehydrogenase